jgi:hypothetical protein
MSRWSPEPAFPGITPIEINKLEEEGRVPSGRSQQFTSQILVREKSDPSILSESSSSEEEALQLTTANTIRPVIASAVHLTPISLGVFSHSETKKQKMGPRTSSRIRTVTPMRVNSAADSQHEMLK